ncbi:hypothetical protein FRC06_011842 [Ceratobasidium sp. 370]|nr:hypothetical protein FRC06_011842 [Ceratobasidium sp. 370]
MIVPNDPPKSAEEAAKSTFGCAVCQDARPLETAVLPSSNCGHVLCNECWDGWMNRQFSEERDGIQVMQGSVNCPVCRKVGVSLVGRPIALHATRVGESEEIQDMCEQIENFQSRQKAIAEEMETIGDEIKQWERCAVEWHGLIGEIEGSLQRFDAVGEEGSGSMSRTERANARVEQRRQA